MATQYRPSSVYKNTPVRDFYLDLWNPPEITATADDLRITVTPQQAGRPDLLSEQLYGTPRFWWIFAMRNPDLLPDPVNDFVAGLEIFAPRPGNTGAPV